MAMIIRTAIVAATAMALCGPVRADDDARSRLAALVRQGDNLMEFAFTIARDRPRSSMQAAMIVQSIGHRWSVDERKFQADLTAANHRVVRDSQPDVQEGLARLGEFDAFVFNGVDALYGCQLRQAFWNLSVAAQLLRHAHLALDGQSQPDWEPDLDSSPEGGPGCS